MSKPTEYGSLFSGFGGMDRGLDAAGLVCKYQVEIQRYARAVLGKHWPNVPKHDDIRTFIPEYTEVVAGGFPCQDISSANRHKIGIEGQQSGLWSEYLRVVRDVRPKIVIIENVSSLVTRGLQTVLSDLAGIGFDVGWRVFCSAEFGFPFMRRRLFMVASPTANQLCRSMQKWKGCRELQRIVGSGPCERWPELLELLMGFPIGYGDVVESETPSYPLWRNG